MRHLHAFVPANDPQPSSPVPPGDASADRRARRRADLVSSLIFAGGSIAVFVILLASLFAATVLYYRWH